MGKNICIISFATPGAALVPLESGYTHTLRHCATQHPVSQHCFNESTPRTAPLLPMRNLYTFSTTTSTLPEKG